MTEEYSPRASQAGHWYNRDGKPVYEVPAKKGGMKKATLREARTMNLVPGVTSITKVKHSEGLLRYHLNQAYMACLTLPRVEGESLDDFRKRAETDAAAHAKEARETGTDIHTVVERHLKGEQHAPIGEKVEKVLRPYARNWVCEKSFAHHLGYGCRTDVYALGANEIVVVDFKGVDAGKLEKAKGYDEHIMQLASNMVAIIRTLEKRGLPSGMEFKLLNVFIARDLSAVKLQEWTYEEAVRGWKLFLHCLEMWKLLNKIDTKWDDEYPTKSLFERIGSVKTFNLEDLTGE